MIWSVCRTGGCLLVVLLVPVPAVYGQTPTPLLRGTVLDTLGNPVSLSEIIAVQTVEGVTRRYLARSDPVGRFSFSDIQAGQYNVTVRRIGYVPIRVALTLQASAPQSIQFEMVPQSQRLPDVLVEVTPERERSGPLLRGTVVDEARRPIGSAEIIIGGFLPRTRGPFQVLTNGKGGFGFSELPPGSYAVKVRRIGYVPIQATLTIDPQTPRAVEFVMSSWPQNLPPIEAKGRRYDITRGIRRASVYDGAFLTRDEIAKAAPVKLGDVLIRYLPSMESSLFSIPNMATGVLPPIRPRSDRATRSGRPRLNAAAQRLQYLGPPCPPVISINGAPAEIGWAVNDFDPQQVEAIEVYRRSDRAVPWEFQEDPIFLRSNCSLVVIWLRER